MPDPTGSTTPASSYTIEFNAPALMSSDTTVMPGLDVDYKEGDRSKRINNSGGELLEVSRAKVLRRKGFFIPDTSYSSDWAENEDDEYIEGEGASGLTADQAERYQQSLVVTGGRGSAAAVLDQAEQIKNPKKANVGNLFPNDKKYGFRFMYNPVTLSFGLGLTRGINTSFIFSGAEKAIPSGISSTGSSIGMNFPISRVDDMGIIDMILSRVRAGDQSIVDNTYGVLRSEQLPIAIKDIKGIDQRVTLRDLSEIEKKGTMYDLDYLFRTMIGRQWKTAYRGYTADVGLAFSVPLMLYLSPTMIYRVRMNQVSYTHKMFTPDMIPIHTDVQLGFERIPDVLGWDSANFDPNSEYQPTADQLERSIRNQ